MSEPKGDIASIKQTISDLFKQQVQVTVNLGGSRILNFCGELSGIYPALFTVTPNDKNYSGKTSFRYDEVLNGSVKITPK